MDPALPARLRTFFSARGEIRLAWLFDSQARGDAAAHSDVDVAVCHDAVDEAAYRYGYLLSLCTDLGDHLGTERVDVVDFRTAPPLLRHRILRDGILLVCRDEELRQRLFCETLREYEDWSYLHQVRMKELRHRIAMGTFGLP